MEIAPTTLPHRPRCVLRRALPAVIVLAALAFGAVVVFLRMSRSLVKWHDDPNVATVWVVGITHGPDLTLSRGGFPLEWLNAHGITALGKVEKVTSRYNGDPNGIEIWFAYRSHLWNHRELECHRVGRTAFMDDLGQAYHGFLDFEGDYVGVYLPAYDHAARRLTCTLHWNPRAPAAPFPVSCPMRFDLDIQPALRCLPAVTDLPVGPVTQTRQGIRVTLGSAYLKPPSYSGYEAHQRDLTFHLDIQGGTLAASNIDPYKSEMAAIEQTASETAQVPMPQPTVSWRQSRTPQNPLIITDPYGCSLVPQRDEVAPMMSLDDLHCTRASDGIVWIAPVNGAGRGTDAIRMRFDVNPTEGGPSIPFDLTVRVRSDAEI